MKPDSFSAVVLAAGRSTRMGRDKALLEVEGVPLWRRQRDVLAQAGATEIFLSVRPDQAWSWRAKDDFAALLHDAMPGCGPLVGITAALERATSPFVAVLAIDLPEMTAAWFRSLVTHAAPGRGVVGRRHDHFEPLAALYPRQLIWNAWEALAGGRYALQPLLGQAVQTGLLAVTEITPQHEPLFRNWNENPEPVANGERWISRESRE